MDSKAAMQMRARMGQVRVHVRWILRRDMPEVLASEASLDAPWTEADLLHHLRQVNVIGQVAEHGERVVGHVVYRLHEGRYHLLRLAVAPDYRRRGVGVQLMRKLKSRLSAHYRNRITAHVPGGELGVQLFLRANGFRCEHIVGDEYAFVYRE